MKILVVTMQRYVEGEVCFRYKTFKVLKETKEHYVIRNLNNFAPVMNRTRIRKNELELIVHSSLTSLYVIVAVEGEVDKNLVRFWYRALRAEAMRELVRRKDVLRSIYNSLHKTAI